VNEGLPQNTIHGIVKDKYGFMWFGTWAGLCRYDGYKFTIYRTEADNLHSINNNRIHNLFKDSCGFVWVVSFNREIVCRYNYETDDFTRFPRIKIKKYISDSLERTINYGRTHIKTKDYLWQVMPRSNLLTQINCKNGNQIVYREDPVNRWALNDEYVTDTYLDDNEILWTGTFNGGINKAYTKAKPFYHYYSTTASNQCIIDNVIRAIYEDNQGNLWIGTRSKGVTRINRKNNIYTHYQTNPQNIPNSLLNNQIRKIYGDRCGYIWIGTKGGLDRFDPRKNQFHHYTAGSKSNLPSMWVYWIMEDHNGNLWIGTFYGLAKYDRKKDRFYAYNPITTLINSHVRVIIEDKKNNLWVATEGGGITRLKRDTSSGFEEKLSPTHFVNSPTDRNSLSDNVVYSLVEDENGILWVGTSSGLNRFDPDKNKFTRFTIKEGLPDEMIMGLLCDKKGYLWISHKKGITRLDTKTNVIRNFTQQDGLQSNEFSEDAYFRNNKTGEMFFGGINGFNAFFPDSIKDDKSLPKVIFTDLQILNQSVPINKVVNGRVVLSKPISLTKEVTFKYSDKSITIEFAALHYLNPQSNKYMHMLEGFDKNWILTAASNRTATYSNLMPGNYIFKVKASNSDGIWNPVPTELAITVLPPWWMSYWAYFIYLIAAGLIFYTVYKFISTREKLKNQVKYERLKSEKMHELEQMKLQFFTSISHEFRTPLTLIIDPLEKIMNGDPNPSLTRKYGSLMYRNAQRLLRMTNQLLDFRKLESGQLRLELTLCDIILFIKNIFENFHFHALQRNIQFTLKSSFESLQIHIDPDKLEKILYNLISNAFKNTPDGGEITLSILLHKVESGNFGTNDRIEISVTDTGIGIPADSVKDIFNIFYQVKSNNLSSGKGTGIGLALTKELVTLHKGEIIVESEQGIGSCFKVLLPVRFPNDDMDTKGMTNNSMSQLDISEKIIDTEGAILENKDNSSNGNFNNNCLPLLLIIEDNNDLRLYLKEELSVHFEIIESSNGSEGLEKSLVSIPDLVISDVMMPGMDGLELCRKLKTDEHTSHIPVILLTAKQSEEYQIEGYETGADAYITKPFNTNILRARINNLIESRQKLRELYSKGPAFDPQLIATNSVDKAFMNKVIEIVEKNLDNIDFDIDLFAENLNMSRAQLYRKIKALTNQTVHDFITTIRLNKAALLLIKGELTISEVAYEVGYTQPNNFSRSFSKQFGQTPSEYINNSRKNAN
jgi:signal transduction histidine kinase/ligand-binding sensor domain-containing protein/DNA-binding response OmpR family regulator